MTSSRIFSIKVLFAVMAVILPVRLWAATRVVAQTTAECPTDGTSCYTNLQTAIAAAAAGDLIKILPGVYAGNFTLDKSITVYGAETARTFISGSGTGTILTINGAATLMNIQNLTFISGSTGISVVNSSNVNITNCIFEIGASATAVQITNSPSTVIMNNTFYQNGTGIYSGDNNISVVNNIFYQSSGAVAISANVSIGGIKNNLFFGGAIGPAVVTDSGDPSWLGNIWNNDPLFADASNVDVKSRDFHLKAGTPCKDAGNAVAGNDSIDNTVPDIGAYGGSKADTVPVAVSDLLATASTDTTVTLSWSPNPCYQIGGYLVLTGTSAGVYGSQVDVGNTVQHTITGLSSTATITGSPVITSIQGTNGTLTVSWDASGVSGATGYEVRYDTVSPPAAFVDAGNTTSYRISGLTNGTVYYIQIVPYAQTTYYFAVRSYYGADTTKASANSNEVSKIIGPKVLGTGSNITSGMPESVNAYPNLPNTGCFIATAAFGSSDALPVQALRRFRDRYLETNSAGRVLVRWYYRISPSAAAFLNNHPALKPIVRGLLWPAAVFAMAATNIWLFLYFMVTAIFVIRMLINIRRRRSI